MNTTVDGGYTTGIKTQRWIRRSLAVGASLIFLVIMHLVFIRPWHIHWGATSQEVIRHMPGDGLVQDPQEVTTRAITINARPHHIWPWLAQMGDRRGGLYSYDRLDQIFGVLSQPSSDASDHARAGTFASHLATPLPHGRPGSSRVPDGTATAHWDPATGGGPCPS